MFCSTFFVVHSTNLPQVILVVGKRGKMSSGDGQFDFHFKALPIYGTITSSTDQNGKQFV